MSLTICFPATDLTLFGVTANSSPWYKLQLVKWEMASGPAPVTFSAPWATTTTVTFTTVGSYSFRLWTYDGVTNESQTVDVDVLSEASQTKFYVDPTFTGGSNAGTETNPWTSLSMDAPDSKWDSINTALASNHVIIYFSPRIAGSDTQETEAAMLNIWRTDTGTNHLTLDGMSKYNTNETTGSWTTYTGTHKFKCLAGMGVKSDQLSYPCQYTRIRGFECTQRLQFVGDYTTVEYCYVHDNTGDAPAIVFHNAVLSAACVTRFGNRQFITIRNVTVAETRGEAIYINSNYIRAEDDACLSWGNTHQHILIENFIITNPGSNNGEFDQGDGIDLKAGLRNVTIRNGIITNPTGGGSCGINSLGLPDSVNDYQDMLIERVTSITGLCQIKLGLCNSAIVRNCITESWFATDINVNGEIKNFNVRAYNNTFGGINLIGTVGITLRNNISQFFEIHGMGATDPQLDSDFNAWPAATVVFENWPSAETNSVALTAPQWAGLFVSAWGGGDYHLLPDAAVIDMGQNLANPLLAGFTNDRDGVGRPRDAGWDIGAYEAIPNVTFNVHN